MIVRKVDEILEYVKRLSGKERQELLDRLEDAEAAALFASADREN
jgi:hypothetical protein